MSMINWKYNDGGRSKYFKRRANSDCVCRAIAIATETDYLDVYNLINEYAKHEHKGKRKHYISSAEEGVSGSTLRKIMENHFHWKWHPCMKIGTGCTIHLRAEELPKGRLIVNVSRHETAVIDGIIQDISDPSRDGTRCVYGYYSKN